MSTETKVAAHTPGPWGISGGRYLGITAVVDGVIRQIGRAEDCNGLIPDEVVTCNARLIRACPEMLQALEACESLIEFYAHREMNAPANGEEAVRETRENLQLYRNALKKARGAGGGRQDETCKHS